MTELQALRLRWWCGAIQMTLVLTAWTAAGGCGSSDAGNPAPDPSGAPVTITFLRHDNSTYRTADNAFFAEYMAAHPNVTIVDTTVDFRTLASTLLGELRRDQFTYDLVLMPPSRICGFASNLTDVPDEV